MWPFRKTNDDSEVYELRKHQLSWPIGTKFKYLGVDMIVTGNFSVGHGITSSYLYQIIKADYLDNNGVIREISFCENEFNSLER